MSARAEILLPAFGPTSASSITPCPGVGVEVSLFDGPGAGVLDQGIGVAPDASGAWSAPYLFIVTFGQTDWRVTATCWAAGGVTVFTYADVPLTRTAPLAIAGTVSQNPDGTVSTVVSGDACPAPASYVSIDVSLEDGSGGFVDPPARRDFALGADGSWSPVAYTEPAGSGAARYSLFASCLLPNATGSYTIYVWPVLSGNLGVAGTPTP